MPTTRQARPAANIAPRHAQNSVIPKNIRPPTNSGMTNCVTPPPRFPQPAAAALAAPTQRLENMIDVWNCVITNEAPIAPIRKRNASSDS